MDSYSLYVFLNDTENSASNLEIEPCDVFIAKTKKEASSYFFYQHGYYEDHYNEEQEEEGSEQKFEDLSEKEKEEVIHRMIGLDWRCGNKIFCIPLSGLSSMKDFLKPYEDKISLLERQLKEEALINALTDSESKEMKLPYEMIDHVMKFA